MKLSKNFIVHEMDNEQILVPIGNTSFSGIVRNNETAAFIIRLLKKDITEAQIVEVLLATYEVNEELAAIGTHKVIENLRRIGAIEE